MRSYILPGLAPSFVCFCDILGAGEQNSYGFLREEEGKKGKMEKLRDETTQRDSLLSCSRRTVAEGVFVPLCGCWSGSCGICSHPVFTPCIYQTLLLQLFLF